MSQQSNFQLACKFNKTFDYPVYPIDSNPLITQVESCNYRCELIKEEAIDEFGKALNENNREEMLDAVCDTLYVLYGACYTFNLCAHKEVYKFGFSPDNRIHLIYEYQLSSGKNVSECNDVHDHMYYSGQISIDQLEESNYKLNNINSITDANGKLYLNKSIHDLYNTNINLEKLLRKAMFIDKNIFQVYEILILLIVNTYNIGFKLTENLDGAFRNVHDSNMSKLCKSISEADETVKEYQEKFQQNESPYDSPYYYELNNGLYVIKNKSTGKALKSINYTPANLSSFL